MIWFLLVLYQVKHFVCDYPLQGKYMLGKFKGGYDWIPPLLSHAAVHGLATFLIALAIKPKLAIWLALFDLVVHFTMDRIKASPNLLGRFKSLTAEQYVAFQKQRALAEADLESGYYIDTSSVGLKDIIDTVDRRVKGNTYFWWALGLDQGVHHLTHYVIIYFLVS